MKLHKEGVSLLISIAVVLLITCLSVYGFVGGWNTSLKILIVLSVVLYILVVNFFRYEERRHPLADRNDVVVCPADGKVVVIEEVEETEILNCRCLQVSIFMNIFNMHVNWIPVNGAVEYVSHQNGRFLAAHLPKASTENERSAVVIKTDEDQTVLVRQIAGAVAQRIVTYPQVGDQVSINENLGFIKFGSRVDLYLPLGTEINVKLGEKVKGNITHIATLPAKSL